MTVAPIGTMFGQGLHPNWISQQSLMRALPAKTIPLHLILITVFGILLPWRKGSEFLDPVMISAYACLGALFAGPASAALFAGDRPQTMRAAMLRVFSSVAYGEGMVIAMLAAGIVTVNYGRRGGWRLPEVENLAASLVLGFCAAIALALFAGWMTLRFSASVARTGMRFVFLLAVVAFFYWPQRLPEMSLPGIAAAVVLAGIMVFLLHRQVNPA
jgi:hypothetical protein